MGKHFYEVEVHYLAYDSIGVNADDEQEAHEMAKVMFETLANGKVDGFISVVEAGTIEVDGEEVDCYTDEHTTRWEW